MSAVVMMHLLRERFYWGSQPREPEPDLVMESEAQTRAFALAGEQDGVLAFLYLYNALQISSVLQPGDRVLDLACGPANQLIQMARLNPDMQFVGIDASPTMLQHAQSGLQRTGTSNVDLQLGDIIRLSGLTDASFDCVTCTMSLHHLPDLTALHATMHEIRRVLKPEGRFYLVDFGRFKLKSTQRFFADDLHESVQFTDDYFNSLRAAFSVQELSAAAAKLESGTQPYATALAPFMVVLRSAFQRPLDAATLQRAKAGLAHLSALQQHNFHNLANWFRMGGYPLCCVLED
jgi:ubiquinone/menaquinone biosynthesis C-methylase UbiE